MADREGSSEDAPCLSASSIPTSYVALPCTIRGVLCFSECTMLAQGGSLPWRVSRAWARRFCRALIHCSSTLLSVPQNTQLSYLSEWWHSVEVKKQVGGPRLPLSAWIHMISACASGKYSTGHGVQEAKSACVRTCDIKACLHNYRITRIHSDTWRCYKSLHRALC